MVQMLYQLDQFGADQGALTQQLQDLFDHLLPELSSRAQGFARELCGEVVARLDQIDEILKQSARNWRLDRMSRVDRSILRVATHELTQAGGHHAAVVIDEAVELAKTFGSEDSPSFVNGVLARVHRRQQ